MLRLGPAILRVLDVKDSIIPVLVVSTALLNSIGNFTSSALVGFLWIAASPLVGFGYSAILLFTGTLLFIFIKGNVEEQAE